MVSGKQKPETSSVTDWFFVIDASLMRESLVTTFVEIGIVEMNRNLKGS